MKFLRFITVSRSTGSVKKIYRLLKRTSIYFGVFFGKGGVIDLSVCVTDATKMCTFDAECSANGVNIFLVMSTATTLSHLLGAIWKWLRSFDRLIWQIIDTFS